MKEGKVNKECKGEENIGEKNSGKQKHGEGRITFTAEVVPLQHTCCIVM